MFQFSPSQRASMIQRANPEPLFRTYHRERGFHAPGIRKIRMDRSGKKIFIEALGRAKRSVRIETSTKKKDYND